MWFGSKGFASVVYGLLVAGSGSADADEIFHLVAITIGLSIVVHSSTDIMVARSFERPDDVPAWQEEPATKGGESRVTEVTGVTGRLPTS